MAWQRILLKLYPEFRDLGYELSKLENPDREMSFGNKEFKLFLTTVLEMYKTDFLKDIEEMRGRQMTNVVI
ncbi:MAG: hypothetical protein ABJF11_16140 [Reichenbachiella sp.]|uniref:hypothetical protein n=1 Tax=Reichenbachiella sp. TaxID=2184521 RepID=UPI00326731CB